MGGLEKRLTSSQLIILGFLVVILFGAMLLMLPAATQDGRGADFEDALFTATSAVCVTGLVVRDTATYWSLFGQSVILLLIQTGGMGVVTLAVAFTSAAGKAVSLKQRSTLQEAISASQVGNIVAMTGFILRLVLSLEAAGALILAFAFSREFGLLRGIWYGIFHSISAFCNAGFDLMGFKEPYASLTYFSSHAVVNLVVMMLIVLGGIGFMTWKDVRQHGIRVERYSMQSKVVLAATAALIFLPALYFFFFEFTEMSLQQRIFCALFQSVTTRTAGFNTADLTALSEAAQAVMIALMLVGGAPGSTAGGMKTTTLAVLLLSASAVMRKKRETQAFGRRIGDDIVRQAAAVLMIYLAFFLGGGMMISLLEDLPLVTALFETASAIGTVGLTLGVTPQLGRGSRFILILLMYLGRVGGLTLFFAAASSRADMKGKLPLEKITVG